MWKPEHRRPATRRGLRYPSDLTDAEWALVEPLIPPVPTVYAIRRYWWWRPPSMGTDTAGPTD